MSWGERGEGRDQVPAYFRGFVSVNSFSLAFIWLLIQVSFKFCMVFADMVCSCVLLIIDIMLLTALGITPGSPALMRLVVVPVCERKRERRRK